MPLKCLPKTVREKLERVIKVKFAAARLTRALEIANNPLSTSYKLTVEDETSTIELFVKYLKGKENGAASTSELYDADVYFNNEIVFYTHLVKLFNECDDADTCSYFLPECVGVIDEEHEKGLIFKALQGYENMDLRNEMSLKLARVVFKKLGDFHAYSFYAKASHRPEFQEALNQLREPLFHESRLDSFKNLMRDSLMDAFCLMKEAFPTGSIYVRKFGLFVTDMLQIMQDQSRLKAMGNGYEFEDNFNVITHGDLWINNLMCKQSDEESPEVVFTDFQGCRYATPVQDLMLILYVGLSKDTRVCHRDELIRCYHKALCEKLTALGEDPVLIYPFSALEKQIELHSGFVVAIALAGLPLYYANETLGVPSDSDGGNAAVSEYIRVVSERKPIKCKNKMIEIIMDAVDRGYITDVAERLKY